jgi:hypothetical protein
MDAAKAIVERKDIRLHVYIAFTNGFNIITHFEQEPNRLFLNANDLSPVMIDCMKETSKYNEEDSLNESLEFEYEVFVHNQAEREWSKHIEERFCKPSGQSSKRDKAKKIKK